MGSFVFDWEQHVDEVYDIDAGKWCQPYPSMKAMREAIQSICESYGFTIDYSGCEVHLASLWSWWEEYSLPVIQVSSIRCDLDVPEDMIAAFIGEINGACERELGKEFSSRDFSCLAFVPFNQLYDDGEGVDRSSELSISVVEYKPDLLSKLLCFGFSFDAASDWSEDDDW